MDTPIDVDEDNQWKHDSEFVKIIKNMYGLVDVVDVDEHDLEASDIFETIPNWFLLKNWI